MYEIMYCLMVLPFSQTSERAVARFPWVFAAFSQNSPSSIFGICQYSHNMNINELMGELKGAPNKTKI